jgi:hypothetical protein
MVDQTEYTLSNLRCGLNCIELDCQRVHSKPGVQAIVIGCNFECVVQKSTCKAKADMSTGLDECWVHRDTNNNGKHVRKPDAAQATSARRTHRNRKAVLWPWHLYLREWQFLPLHGFPVLFPPQARRGQHGWFGNQVFTHHRILLTTARSGSNGHVLARGMVELKSSGNRQLTRSLASGHTAPVGSGAASDGSRQSYARRGLQRCTGKFAAIAHCRFAFV